MSATNPESRSGSSSHGSGSRFPAPRPRAQSGSGSDETATLTASRPAAKPTRPTAPRPASGRSGSAAAAPPRGGRQQGLVRPTPKAKVRKARLLVSRVDPWSVLKMSFLLSVALGIMTVVCAVMLWSVMDLSGIFERVDTLLAQVLGDESGYTVEEMVTLGQVASFATIIAVINVVLLTVISMLSAVLYNISASLVGGIGVTLTDD
ncbi:DUF3566 domain-containing protein [Nesterenkonia sp. F]|uniref:DUF3566 domain-containing protein n=1 Tax=Nesterenkonia sp. F TaxID=795955 RepID=UPI000255D2AA|nr:DUF3566 domain-containing protein [Nesterenkonia sp. F]